MRWIKRTFLFLLGVIILVSTSLGVLVWKYEDDLKAYALETVRSAVTSEVSFNEEVKLSFWDDFPLVAVEFSDLRVEDAFASDTLLTAGRAFVQFNLAKLFQNNIVIEGIRLTDGFIRIERNEAEKWNFFVWKKPEEPEKQRAVDLNIELLTLENVQLGLDDRKVDLRIRFYSERSKLKGRFTSKTQRLGLSILGHLHQLRTSGADRIVDMPLQLAGVLELNAGEGVYTIEMGNAVLAGNEMVFDAEWAHLASGTDIDMRIHAGNIEPHILLPHVWPQMPINIRKLNLSGRSDLVLSLSGPFTRHQGPKLEATVRMRNGGLHFQDTEVSQLNFEGQLFMQDIKRSSAMEVAFKNFDLKTPKGVVKGSGTLTNLAEPRLRLNCTGNSELAEIIAVSRLEEEMTGNGTVSWNIDFEGPLGKGFNTSMAELNQMRWSGEVGLSEANIRFHMGVPDISKLNARIEMKRTSTSVRDCSGQIGHLVFDGSVEMNGLKSILTDPMQPVRLDGAMHIASIDVQQLPLEWTLNQDADPKTAHNAERPLFIHLDAAIDEVTYNDFSATDAKGVISLQNDQLHVSDLRFEALDGTVSGDLHFAPENSGYLMRLTSELNRIDMNRALREWDDFGQTGITSENLNGRASVGFDATIYLDQDLQLVREKLQVESDILISGGELVDFEPLQALSRFISVDELQRVRFDTLRNHLSIREDRLVIPSMAVSSSILTVRVFGEHGFDQDMDYHVNLLVSDLLRRKTKRQRVFEGHEIIDNKGKARLFLWIRGRPGDLKVGFDKREVRRKVKEDLRQEGQTIKRLFKDEFGGRTAEESESEVIQFRLEDPDAEISPEAAAPIENTGREKPQKKKRLFDMEAEEEETEGGFEIEFDP